ncbi:MAG: GNAT family N-acetyltransferase [Granulosicoccus sp.]
MKLHDSDEPVQAIIHDNGEFESLAEEWADLLNRSKSACVFMRWEWHYTWWQVFAGNRDVLHIVTWRQQGRLVGLLPLYLSKSLFTGSGCLRFLGTGELQIDEVATEYCDLLADENVEDQVAHLAGHYLGSFSAWNCVELYCMVDTALLLNILIAREDIFSLERSVGQRYRIPLNSNESCYLDGLASSRSKRIRRSQRAGNRDGGICAVPISSISDFDRAFRELAELNHERQAHKQRKSVFASSRFRHFHYELCLRLHDSGAANIIRFQLNSRLIAVLYCFYDEQSCHYYQSGFARKDANKYMPLTLAHLIEMQRNRDAGRSYYDLMRGKPPCYKDEFGCETTPMGSLSLYKSSTRRALAVHYRALRAKVAELVKRRP